MDPHFEKERGVIGLDTEEKSQDSSVLGALKQHPVSRCFQQDEFLIKYPQTRQQYLFPYECLLDFTFYFYFLRFDLFI